MALHIGHLSNHHQGNYKCDGDNDCHDNSDEVDCPTKPACQDMDVNVTGCGHRFFTQNIVNNPHHKIVGGIKAVKGD